MPPCGDPNWLNAAWRKTRAFRADIKLECFPFHHWPIWIRGNDLGFPSDDVLMPDRPPANDNGITLIFR